MAFKKYVAMIAATQLENITGRNMVVFKSGDCEISIYRDAACTIPIVSIGIAATEAYFENNHELAGAAWIKSSADSKTVTINQW